MNPTTHDGALPALVSLLTYFAIGGAAGFALAKRENGARGRALTFGISLVAWPLWVPVAALSAHDELDRGSTDLEKRIHAALDEAVAAIRGSALSSLLPEASVAAIRARASRATARIAELEATVERANRGAGSVRERLVELEHRGASGTAARVHLENLRKLAKLLDDERAGLLDLADLCDALRSQLVLARFAGSSLDGVGELVAELDARVEGLDSALATVVSDSRLS